MQQGEYKLVPFLGINNEVLNDQSPDGLCDEIINLKPKGVTEQPYWVPFEDIGNLSNGATPFTYTHGIANIMGAFWQIRNFVGDFSSTASTTLKRLVVLCDKVDRHAIDIIDPVSWAIVKTLILGEGAYSMTFTRENEITVINLVRDGQPYKLYYLIDDLFIEQGWPNMPKLSYESTFGVYTDIEVAAGQNGGIPRKDVSQYFMVRWAFRLFDGLYVKHDRPQLVEVPSGLGTNSILPQFTMEGYDIPLENADFWEAFISGVSVFCTAPKLTEKEALTDFAYYEVGFFPFLDRKPMEEWDTPNDPNILKITANFITWLTQITLGIDNFTHHKISANVVDSYNNRVLIGGVSTDFTKPTFSIPDGVVDYIDGEAYTEYYTIDSGSRVIDVDYYLNDGTVSDQANAEYENQVTTTLGSFSPLTGREFKLVTIKEIAFVPTPGVTPDFRLFPIHQYSADIVAGKLDLSVVVKESTFNGVFIAPFMVVEIQIGDTNMAADEIILVTITPTNLNLSPYFGFAIQVQTTILANFVVSYEVTIKTQSGTYKRIYQETAITGQRLLFPNILYYPDRRAINYKISVLNLSVHELVLNKKLTQHPSLNYSYVKLFPQEMQYFIGGIITATTAPDLSVNTVNQWDKNRAQASITDQPLVFEAAASYRVGSRERDSIQAFGVNTIDISQGQFGQYPLYVFSDKSVWALEQSGDPDIAFGRIVPVSVFNGLNNTYAICNAENIIVAVDSNYIYSFMGLEAERIDRPISHDPDYTAFINGIRLAYHKASDYEEVLFSNPAFSYTWVFNLRYKAWYKWSKSFRFYFQDQPNILGITTTNQVKEFSRKNTSVMIPWKLKTRPINLGSRYYNKRLLLSQIRTVLKQIEPNKPLTLTLEMERAEGGLYNAMEYLKIEETTKDLWLRTNFGSFQSMVVTMEGESINQGSFIHQIELNYEMRNVNRVRR